MNDGSPRHLNPVHPDEPPYDPEHDRSHNHAVADREAERALLTALLKYPEIGTQLADEVNRDDFYWPVHQQVWTAWHDLAAAEPVPPDYVVLNATLLATKQSDAVRAVLDLITSETNSTVSPALASKYAGIIRDHARRRAFVDAGTRIIDLAHKAGGSGLTDTYLAEALQTLDDSINHYGGPRSHLGIETGLTDLSWVADGTEPPKQPPPVYVQRTDGHALFYPGQVNGIIGDPEHGKTWLAQVAIVEALNAGRTAAMVDTDHNGPNATAARLLLLGARIEQIADPALFRYYEPQDAEQLVNASAEIAARRTDVALIDSLGEVFGLLGVNENHGDEVTSAMRRICTVPAMAGTCVITVDHLPKSNEARATGFAIGSIAKKRMIRGAYLRADAKQKPAPGQIGRITLRIEKDTMGELRRSSGGGYAGTLVLDSTHDYALEWSVRREELPKNADGTWRPTHLMERVARYVEDHDGCSGKELEDDIPGKGTHIRDAIKVLVHEGFIARVKGPRGAWQHQSLIPYREAEDDHAEPAE